MKIFSLIFLFMCNIFAMNLDTIQANKWYKVPVTWGNDPFQSRSWGTLKHGNNGDIIFYDGIGPTSHGNYCIYANSLLSINLLSDSGKVLKQSNYFCNAGIPTPLPENQADSTPMDRHVYNQFAFSSIDTSVYLVHGASGSDNHQHDFWKYSINQNKWFKLNTPPGGSAGWDCNCELNFIYAEGELWFFLNGRDIYAYNISSALWRYHRIGEDRYAISPVGAHGTYDTLRKRFVFYGGMYNGVSNLMPMFQKDSLQWSIKIGPASLRYAAIEYNSKHDVYMLGKGEGNDQIYIYNPSLDTWAEMINTGTLAPKTQFVEMVYNKVHDVLVNQKQDDFYIMRYAPAQTIGIRKTVNFFKSFTINAKEVK